MKSSWRMIARVASLSGVLFLMVPPLCMAQTGVPTVTNLTISPSGPVSAGTVLTLTATVTSGGNIVNPGQVLFCNAAAAHCNDLAILGRAQLTSAGVATVRLRLGIGSHSIKAIFAGTPHSAVPMAASTSSTQSLSVTGLFTATTSFSIYGVPGDYTLQGIVDAYGRQVPDGTLTFADTNRSNSPLATFSLDDIPASANFLPSSLPPYLAYPIAVDLNNDGFPDVVGGGGVALMGNGDGTFTVLPEPNIGNSPVVSGDFNSDGIPDLAQESSSGTIVILLGKGDGTFNALAPFAGGGYTPVVADFNGDGIPDLAVLAPNVSEPTSALTILLGNGDGTFTAQPAMSGIKWESLAVADFNNDGIPDLVTDDLDILLGNGDGTFAVSTAYEKYAGGYATVGDFNGDGKADVQTEFSILLGRGNGTFDGTSTYDFDDEPYQQGPSIMGDFNGDGIEDLIALNSANLFLGRGDGTFVTGYNPVFSYQYNDPWLGVAADFNGDGLTDVLLAYEYSHPIMLGLGGRSRTVQLKDVSITGEGNHNLVATYSGDANYAPSESSPVNVVNSTATPVLTPSPGRYDVTQFVKVTDRTPGAVLYYTLDGSTPTVASARYSAPFKVSSQATIHALAVSPVTGLSAVAGGRYEIGR